MTDSAQGVESRLKKSFTIAAIRIGKLLAFESLRPEGRINSQV